MSERKNNDQIGKEGNLDSRQVRDDARNTADSRSSHPTDHSGIRRNSMENERDKEKDPTITRKEHDDTNHPHEFDTPGNNTEDRIDRDHNTSNRRTKDEANDTRYNDTNLDNNKPY